MYWLLIPCTKIDQIDKQKAKHKMQLYFHLHVDRKKYIYERRSEKRVLQAF